MAKLLEQIGAELSIFRDQGWTCSWNKTLHYCHTEIHYDKDAVPYRPHEDDHFLHDLLMKMLRCGRRPNCTYPVESLIVETYGEPFKIQKRDSKIGRITYKASPKLKKAYQSFTDVFDPWQGNSEEVPLDPKHPENERRFFDHLIEHLGSRVAHCIQPQVPLEDALPPKVADSFMEQRGDFYLCFPNGRSILLEPGDHDESQQELDKKRDAAFQETLRCITRRYENKEIDEPETYTRLRDWLEKEELLSYFEESETERSEEQLSQNYLFLLPTLIARMERLLTEFYFRRGLFNYDLIRIGILERDLECAEIALFSFLERTQRMMKLYGIEKDLPQIHLQIERNGIYRFGDLSAIRGRLKEVCPGIKIEEVEELKEELTLFLDVGIKCNRLTPPRFTGSDFEGFCRRTFRHFQEYTFQYRVDARPLGPASEAEPLLQGFLQDFFRKESLRPGQLPIVENILNQKSTIGLLPTSAGKSICYQLASLLTPGVTFVVDPLIALMDDQVQGLKADHGIDRVFALHSGSKVKGDQIGKVISEQLMVFLSPERFQSPDFRTSLQSVGALETFVNYAVIDEAHCVSMWGHDFRPPYLLLEKNLRQYCSYRGKEPIIVALTGTASQMVLIDLQRELNIQNTSHIVRPKTFDRPELSFELHRCAANQKASDLQMIDQKIKNFLNVNDLYQEADGIVFVPTVGGRNGCWALFGKFVKNAASHVQTVLSSDHEDEVIPFGIYTGKAPKDSGFNAKDWGEYKRKTLEKFKRGKIKRLFGTKSVSVGIDNPHLNYVINYAIPASLEQFIQQSGRAGRGGQESLCILLASNGNLQETREWLEGDIDRVSDNRWDDISTLDFFHKGSFPGTDVDMQGLELVLKHVLEARVLDNGYREISEYLSKDMIREKAERTERYLCYLLIMNVVGDYQTINVGSNRRFQLKLSKEFEEALKQDDDTLKAAAVIEGLFRYRQRYLVQEKSDLEADFRRSGEPWDLWAIQNLITFVYENVEYRRREQMRTMVNFCEEEDTSPEALRYRIRLYFDGNPKFTPDLEALRDVKHPDFHQLDSILSKIKSWEDVDSLIWGARSLLDELFHWGWAAIYLYSTLYRSKGDLHPEYERVLKDLISNWREELDRSTSRESCVEFFTGFLKLILKLEEPLGKSVKPKLVHRMQSALSIAVDRDWDLLEELLPRITPSQQEQENLRLPFVSKMLKEILDVSATELP